MELFAKEKRTGLVLIAAASAILLFLLGLWLGMAIAEGKTEQSTPETAMGQPSPALRAETSDPPEAPAEEGQTPASSAEGAWEEVHFSACGHVLCREERGEPSLSTFAGGEASAHAGQEARSLRETEGYCPAHYVLVMEDGLLFVMHRDAQSLTNERLMQLSVDLEELPAALMAELEAGLAFDSLAEIDEYIENLES